MQRSDGTTISAPTIVDHKNFLREICEQHICPHAYINNRTGESLIERLPEEFQHFAVNYSVNFADPNTGAHTQTIESTWQKFKRRHKQEFGTHRSVFCSYVSDFVWRKKFSGPDVMFSLWSQIVYMYVCE